MVIVPPPVEKLSSLLAELIPRLMKNGKMGGQDGYVIIPSIKNFTLWIGLCVIQRAELYQEKPVETPHLS